MKNSTIAVFCILWFIGLLISVCLVNKIGIAAVGGTAIIVAFYQSYLMGNKERK